MAQEKNTLYCSFCGKSQHEVRKLIAGPTVFICDECVELCMDIIREENKNTLVKSRDGVPTPHEIKSVLDSYVIGQEHAKRQLRRLRCLVEVPRDALDVERPDEDADLSIEEGDLHGYLVGDAIVLGRDQRLDGQLQIVEALVRELEARGETSHHDPRDVQKRSLVRKRQADHLRLRLLVYHVENSFRVGKARVPVGHQSRVPRSVTC